MKIDPELRINLMIVRLKRRQRMNKKIGYIAVIAAVLLLSMAFAASADTGNNTGGLAVSTNTPAATAITTTLGVGPDITESTALIMPLNQTYNAEIGVPPLTLQNNPGAIVVVGFVPAASKTSLVGYYTEAKYNANGMNCNCYTFGLPYVPKKTEEGAYTMHTLIYNNMWGLSFPYHYVTNVTLVRLN